MDISTSVDAHHDPHAHDASHEHHELGWWRKYIFSTDHKVIGIQYGLCGLAFLFFGFCLMMMMRWQLAYPGQALPVIGKWLPHIFGPGIADGKMTPDFYNSLGAMHGTIMIFAGVVPLAFAAFGNFVVPLQIGAPDMTFPKVNAASFWAFGVGGVIMMISFFVPGGPAKSGWTSYTPLADISDTGPGHNPLFNGQTLWLIGFIFLISSSLLGAVNFITTIIQLRAKGLTWMRLPFFVWAQFVTAFLLLLAFPPLEAAIVMRIAGDAIPGSLIPIWFTPVKTGNYEVICAQLCGLGHYGMKGTLVVDTPQDYQAWLKERAELAGTQTTPPPPTQRPPGEPISGAPPGTIPPPGAPKPPNGDAQGAGASPHPAQQLHNAPAAAASPTPGG